MRPRCSVGIGSNIKELYNQKQHLYDRRVLKGALAAACTFTLLATVYLSVSLMVLRPPRADDQQWSLVAALITIQGMLTLVELFVARSAPARCVALVGGVAIALVGARSVYSTLSGPHFEGYALVLGSALVVQGALTLVTFAGRTTEGVRHLHDST